MSDSTRISSTGGENISGTISNSNNGTQGDDNLVAATATMTITRTTEPQTQNNNDEVLRLTLQSGPNVTWDENVIDNEGLGRKSSKRCCIFHKQRAFGESSTDSSDYDSDDNKKPIARKKKTSDIEKEKKKTPDHLRFHA